MDKKKGIIIAISAILLVAICVTIGISGVLSPYQRQIRLGYKLLEQGNYEEAILAFDKAIEIDVKRAKAYIGKADVYVTRCDENTLEDTKKVIETGYAQRYDDEAFVDAIIRLADELYAKDQRKWAVELLNFGYELTNDNRIKERKNQIIDELSEFFLSELYAMFENGENDAVKKEIQSEKYLEFMSFVDNEEFKYIYFPDKNKEQTGKGIALYFVDSEEFGNVFVYYGDFSKGIRSGTGTWVGANGEKYYWFEGAWSEDAPNGTGSETEYTTAEDKDSNQSYNMETKGNYVNGLLEGTFVETIYIVDGAVLHFDNAIANNGVLARNGCGEPDDEDGYCAAVSSGSEDHVTHWISNGELYGVEGFYKN